MAFMKSVGKKAARLTSFPRFVQKLKEVVLRAVSPFKMLLQPCCVVQLCPQNLALLLIATANIEGEVREGYVCQRLPLVSPQHRH